MTPVTKRPVPAPRYKSDAIMAAGIFSSISFDKGEFIAYKAAAKTAKNTARVPFDFKRSALFFIGSRRMAVRNDP